MLSSAQLVSSVGPLQPPGAVEGGQRGGHQLGRSAAVEAAQEIPGCDFSGT